MKKLLFAAVLALISIGAYAQSDYYQVNGTYNFKVNDGRSTVTPMEVSIQGNSIRESTNSSPSYISSGTYSHKFNIYSSQSLRKDEAITIRIAVPGNARMTVVGYYASFILVESGYNYCILKTNAQMLKGVLDYNIPIGTFQISSR